MLNMCQILSIMAASEGPVAEFSSFANFEERKRKSNHLMSFPKIVHQRGSVISLLSADSRYFRTYALKLCLLSEETNKINFRFTDEATYFRQISFSFTLHFFLFYFFCHFIYLPAT